MDDPTRATIAHAETLAATDGFTIAFNGTLLTTNETVQPVRWTQRVDTTDSRIYAEATTPRGTVSRYFANDTLYVRETPRDGDPQYSSGEVAYDIRRFTGGGIIRPALANISFESPRQDRLDGHSVYRFDSTSIDPAATPFGGEANGGDIRNFQARLTVDQPGSIRELSYRAEVRHDDRWSVLEVTVLTERINQTAVDRPDWTDNAD